MSTLESGREPKPGEQYSDRCRIYPSARDINPQPSTSRINPLKISFTEDEASEDESDVLANAIYKCDDAEYDKSNNAEHKKTDKHTSEKMDGAQSKSSCDKGWSRTVWRKVAPTSKNFTNARDTAERAMTSVKPVVGRVLAAGISISSSIRDSSLQVYNKKFTDTKKAEDEIKDETDDECLYAFSTSSSESSHSSGASPSADGQDLWEPEVIHRNEGYEPFTPMEAPDVKDDWDMIPEADHFLKVYKDPLTINAEIREYYEKERRRLEAKRAAWKEANKEALMRIQI